MSAGHLGVDVHDLVEQRLTSFHDAIEDGHASTFQSPHRYVRPAELALMAQLDGLTFTERWADFSQQPFTAESEAHVSVWARPIPPQAV